MIHSTGVQGNIQAKNCELCTCIQITKSRPLLEINCTIGFVLCSVSQYYLSFKLSGKVVFFHLFCHLSFSLFAPAAIVHSFSNYIVALRDDR